MTSPEILEISELARRLSQMSKLMDALNEIADHLSPKTLNEARLLLKHIGNEFLGIGEDPK